MSIMTSTPAVVAGIDTHLNTHHVAVIDQIGRRVGDRKFDATAPGHRELIAWLSGHGIVSAVGVEGTGSYGAALSRLLAKAGFVVIEVICSNRAVRRLRGKSDPLDAYAAAETVLAGRASAVPKSRDGAVEAMRVLRLARNSAVKARTAAVVQIKTILAAADDDLRARYQGMSTARMLAVMARSRPDTARSGDPATATTLALKSLARRAVTLSEEIKTVGSQLDRLTDQHAPGLKAVHGVGTDIAAQLLITAGDNPDRIGSEAQFAALTGTAPIPASSGKTSRHRLSRGGDRAANRALYQVVIVRMAHDPRTRAYVQRRRAEGLSNREIIRCLKRFVARELFKHLLNPQAAPTTFADLRTARQAAGHTLTLAAAALSTNAGALSRIERGLHRNLALEQRYRDWLTARPSAA